MYHLLAAADRALDALDRPLHDWEHLRPAIRLPRWLRHLYRCSSRLLYLGAQSLRQNLQEETCVRNHC